MTDNTDAALRAILLGFADASHAFDKIAAGLHALAPGLPRPRKAADKSGAEYRSPLQSAIVEAIHLRDYSVDHLPLDVFVDTVVALLPVPEGGRDTRRQSVKRAIEGFSKKAEAPLLVKGEIVVFYE